MGGNPILVRALFRHTLSCHIAGHLRSKGGITRRRGGRMPPRMGAWQPGRLRYDAVGSPQGRGATSETCTRSASVGEFPHRDTRQCTVRAIPRQASKPPVISTSLRISPVCSLGTVYLVDASVYLDRKSTRLNSSHANISYAVFC